MILQSFKYHQKLRDHLKLQPKTWEWFSNVKVREEQLAEFKTELLKNTYRLDRESNPEIYQKVDLAKDKLALTLDVTVYQAQNSMESNAGISYLPGEAHLVLSGPILKLLSEKELLAVIAHELSHIRFFMLEQADFEVADRVITSIANDYRSEDVYIETARLFRLYMELFCDRGALLVTEDAEAVMACLIKVNTGLDKVNVASYLKQAEEIFAAEKKAKAEHVTHPENYIRVRALNLWEKEKEKAEEEITKMIEGDIQLNSLDIFKQSKIQGLSFDIMKLMLKPKWMRSTAVISLSREYKSDFNTDDAIVITDDFLKTLGELSKSIKEYLSYVLLDFALVDPTLEEVPLGFAFQLAEDLTFKDEFNEVVKKELKLGERKLMELQKRAAKALAEMKESNEEHIYKD